MGDSERALETLVDRARAGASDAQSAVLARLEPMLRAYFVRRIGRHPDLDDLVQNTLLRVFRGFDDLKESGSIRAFALKAALFELQDLYRGRYAAREVRQSPDAPEPSTPPASEGTRIDVDRALAGLSPRARQVIELKALGYRYAEIARHLDTTEAAVKMQVKRALERLRDFLAVIGFFLTALFPP